MIGLLYLLIVVAVGSFVLTVLIFLALLNARLLPPPPTGHWLVWLLWTKPPPAEVHLVRPQAGQPDHMVHRFLPATVVELMVVVAIIAIVAAVGITLYQNAEQKARLAADRGTLAAMRSAIAIYYMQHNGDFPATPGSYVNPTPPAFQCVNLTYTYDSTAGQLKIASTNDVTDCP